MAENATVGANEIVSMDPAGIVAAANAAVETDADWRDPFNDRTAAQQILDIVHPYSVKLRIRCIALNSLPRAASPEMEQVGVPPDRETRPDLVVDSRKMLRYRRV